MHTHAQACACGYGRAGPCRCVMEVFAWLQMGGRREDIQIVRLGSRCSLADDLSRFSLESSRCGLAADRERLLGAIEAAFGDFQPFNRCIRIFLRRTTAVKRGSALA